MAFTVFETVSFSNLENIHYFPSICGGTISLHHSFHHISLDVWKLGMRGGGTPIRKARDVHWKISI